MKFDLPPVKIDLNKLKELFNPFESNVWVKIDSPITIDEITDYINKGLYQSPDIEVKHDLIWDVSDRDIHLKRIAWLVKNYDSEQYPILIDFGIPSLGMGFFEISDGCHRVAAAIYRNDKFIYADCSGEVNEIEKYKLN